MTPTVEYIREHFDLYNRQMFGGTLTVPPIYLTNARTYMGQMTCRKRTGLFGKKHFSDFALRFSRRFDFSETELQDTLIHEMIHYYIACHQLQDISAHGQLFRQMMNDINQKYGRHITVSHRITNEERLQLIGSKPRPRIFAVVRLADGEHYIKSVPRIEQRVLTMHRRISFSPQVSSLTWYYSSDPFFALFPSSMGTRMQRVDLVELQLHLASATPLICDGRTLRRG
ncbi:MAG: SprT-like domain-containing protein [Paludibacteraceae bacterium]|nr:SprT-like domain-containing protein [Paludibacteraceae bacterium]